MLSISRVFIPVNVVYNVTHQGSWQVPFPKHATEKDASFITLDGEEKRVQMMKLRANLQFANFHNLHAKAVRLAFEQ